MNRSLSRRKFMSAAVAAGAATLLPSTETVLAASRSQQAAAQAVADDTANQNLTNASIAKVQWKAKPFPMPQVRLLPSFWKDTMELNRSYLYSLPNERLAHNFRVNAGIPSDADPLGGWEAPDCELRGHYVGHYLSACALMHASTGDEVIASKASALVGMLAECQAKDGYLERLSNRVLRAAAQAPGSLGAFLHLPQDHGRPHRYAPTHRQPAGVANGRAHGRLGRSLFSFLYR